MNILKYIQAFLAGRVYFGIFSNQVLNLRI